MSYARVDAAPEGPATAGQARGPAPQANGATAPGGRIFASPLARRIAKEAGLDLATIQGSGPHGRIVERDVRKAMQERPRPSAAPPAAAPQPAAPAPAAAPAPKPAASAPAGMSDEQVKKFFEPGSFEEIPHDGMRKTIARRLTESKQTIPHFYLTVDVELDALLALREQINGAAGKDKDGKPAYKVSVNDFVIKALALALMRVPDANVSWTEGAMLKHRHADVGVAVSIPGGLITPVVRKAEIKTLSAISNEMKDFAARARARKLKPEEYQGGSTAVSNLGMFGVKDFAAVINPPHATILAVGAGEKRVVVKDGQPAVATMMSATLSTDHRAVDGALGAELLAAFRGLVEAPMGMLV
jgi:pyruvate dehydrogenase E2 component (dihydrolipoamide acetyltransferase)